MYFYIKYFTYFYVRIFIICIYLLCIFMYLSIILVTYFYNLLDNLVHIIYLTKEK